MSAAETSAAPAPGAVESLDDLGAEARSMAAGEQHAAEAAVVTQQQAEQRREQQQQNEEALAVAALLRQLRDVTGAMAEDAGYLGEGRTRAIWSDERLQGIAGPLVVIMHRHGGGLGEWMQQWGPYLALVAAAAMPVGATIREVREQRAARAATAGAGEGEGGQQQPA